LAEEEEEEEEGHHVRRQRRRRHRDQVRFLLPFSFYAFPMLSLA
jgi:hypothetical protein